MESFFAMSEFPPLTSSGCSRRVRRIRAVDLERPLPRREDLVAGKGPRNEVRLAAADGLRPEGPPELAFPLDADDAVEPAVGRHGDPRSGGNLHPREPEKRRGLGRQRVLLAGPVLLAERHAPAP